MQVWQLRGAALALDVGEKGRKGKLEAFVPAIFAYTLTLPPYSVVLMDVHPGQLWNNIKNKIKLENKKAKYRDNE